MAKVLINNQYLTNIGDAIREKNGSTTTYKPSEMPDAIQGWYSVNDYYVIGGLTGAYSNSEITTLGQYALSYQDITEIDLPNITELTSGCFEGCENLVSVNLPNVEIIDGSYAFRDCSNLTTVFFPKLKQGVNAAFDGCSKLDTLILGGETMVISFQYNIGSGFLSGTAIDNGNGYIYVRRALYDSYCNNTSYINWSQYKDQIRIIEDYPEYWALINWAGRDWATSTWEELSWSEVYGLCKSRQNGEIAGYPPYIQLGAVKNVDVNGVSVPMYLIGIDQDGVGVLTFQALEGVSEIAYFEDTTEWYLADSSVCNYGASFLKTQCDIFYNNCEAKDYIKPLLKSYCIDRNRLTTKIELLPVWLPSASEMSPTIDASVVRGDSGVIYQYFANNLYVDNDKKYWTRSIVKFYGGTNIDGVYYDLGEKMISICGHSEYDDAWNEVIMYSLGSTEWFAPAFAIG